MKLFSGSYLVNLHHEDRLIIGLEASLILCGLIGIILNAATFQYKGSHYISFAWLWLVPTFIGMVTFSFYFSKANPKVAFLMKIYGLYFLAFFAFLVVISGIQYTPFPTIDPLLASTDQLLNIKETVILDWSYAHPLLVKVLKLAYHGVVYQLIAMPLLLFFLRKKTRIYFYLVTSLIAYIIGAIVYYIFPTVGPAGVFSDPHFNAAQIDIALRYKETHQYLLLTTFDAGLITFPSFHVLWSVITLYTLRKTPVWFYAPLLILNITAIFATFLLGWSYAIDIIGGLLLAFLSIYLAKRLLKNSMALKWKESINETAV